MECIICGYKEKQEILDIFDPVENVAVVDYWCPQCHTTDTMFLYPDGTVVNNYHIKG